MVEELVSAELNTKKVTYKNLGKYEIEDQITAAKWLGNQSYVDKSESESLDGALEAIWLLWQ